MGTEAGPPRDLKGQRSASRKQQWGWVGGCGGGWGGLQRSEKLAERRAAEEAFTWDVTLGRPIQHCEGHNRQGWPRTYTHTYAHAPPHGPSTEAL